MKYVFSKKTFKSKQILVWFMTTHLLNTKICNINNKKLSLKLYNTCTSVLQNFRFFFCPPPKFAKFHRNFEPWSQSGFKISAKFQPNFTKFGNFGGGQKKTPKFFNTLIHVLYNSNLIFFYCLYYIFFYLIDM